nr:uncharacterized protein LOC109740376 [Aegilops tauschii subsp. strangulata]
MLAIRLHHVQGVLKGVWTWTMVMTHGADVGSRALEDATKEVNGWSDLAKNGKQQDTSATIHPSPADKARQGQAATPVGIRPAIQKRQSCQPKPTPTRRDGR